MKIFTGGLLVFFLLVKRRRWRERKQQQKDLERKIKKGGDKRRVEEVTCSGFIGYKKNSRGIIGVEICN